MAARKKATGNAGKGRLLNGNPSGDPSTAPRCGAQTRSGRACASPAIRGKPRCRMHGGRSTGPRTPEGLARSRRARWVHGRFSEDTRRARVAAVERSQAKMWEEYAPWAHTHGFLIQRIRERGFHGVRLRRPYGWRELKRRLNAVLTAERKRILKARRASRA